jgi:hypothetical protein
VHRGPFVRGGVVHGRNFASHGGFVYRHGFGSPVHFYRPYYTFHPNVRIGFGLFAGYPFAYPYAFYNPYYYPYRPYYSYNRYPPHGFVSSYGSVSSGAAPTRSVAVPDQTDMGGLSFEITPDDAELFVDGIRVGTVGEFTSTTQPLALAAGNHHVEIRAAGYQPISFDVDVVAGQVHPYEGSLER